MLFLNYLISLNLWENLKKNLIYSAPRIIWSAPDRKKIVQIIRTSNNPNKIWYEIENSSNYTEIQIIHVQINRGPVYVSLVRTLE